MSDFENHYYEEEFGCMPDDPSLFLSAFEEFGGGPISREEYGDISYQQDKTGSSLNSNAPIECEAHTLRTCPRCGAKLFEDMSTCYGCLYDFEQSEHIVESTRNNPLCASVPIPQGDDELWGSLDEIIPEAQPVRSEFAPDLKLESKTLPKCDALPRMPRTIRLDVGDSVEIISGESTLSIKAIR